MASSFSYALFALFLTLLSTASSFDKFDYDASVDKFTGHFYKAAADRSEGKNMVVSGLSADIAFAMVGKAALGETQQEISKALFLENVDEAAPAIKTFFEDQKAETLQQQEGVTLNLANKLYVKPSSDGKLDSLNPTYRTAIQDVFKGDVQQVDFMKSQVTANTINSWVEQQTNNRIKNLIDPDSLTSYTAAVLVNAIYFKGAWANKFDERFTKSEDFHLADGSTIKVDMMKQRAEIPYAESAELDAKIVLIPYKNRNVQMVVVLPNKVDGLAQVQTKLQDGIIHHLSELNLAQVNLKLPKFKIESTIDGKPIFKELGAKRCFTPVAELNNMLKNEEAGVYISEVVQKAFIEVNEEGAEAAAASGVVANTRIAKQPSPARDFKADHPFYFAIIRTGTVLFSGHKLN